MQELVGKKVRIAYDGVETECPIREDGVHCNCWYDEEACCACHDPGSNKDVYIVTKSLSENKVMIVDDPADPKIIDSIPVSLLIVVD